MTCVNGTTAAFDDAGAFAIKLYPPLGVTGSQNRRHKYDCIKRLSTSLVFNCSRASTREQDSHNLNPQPYLDTPV